MGDSRFHFKATFSIYGKSFDWDASLNWSAEPGEIDRRITEWLLESHDCAYQKWLDDCAERDAENIQRQISEKERAMLKHLREKYPDPE